MVLVQDLFASRIESLSPQPSASAASGTILPCGRVSLGLELLKFDCRRLSQHWSQFLCGLSVRERVQDRNHRWASLDINSPRLCLHMFAGSSLILWFVMFYKHFCVALIWCPNQILYFIHNSYQFIVYNIYTIYAIIIYN